MRVPAVLVLVALLLAPAASAGFSPSLYYLAPGGVADGSLSEEAPEGESSSSAFATALPADAPSAVFVALEGPNATHVLGRVLVGLWVDLGVAQGSVEARFVLVEDGETTLLASAAQPVSTDPEDIPEPTALLPPDPTDPQGAVFHAAAQAMPLLAHPPVLLDLGVLDVEVHEGAVAGLELRLVEDNATGAPASGVVRVQYAAAATPSFVYVPWWSGDEAAPGEPGGSPQAPDPSRPDGPSGGGASEPDDGPEPTSGGRGSPGLPVVLLAGLVAAAAAVRRRR